jgi:hypothetical protein
MGKYIPSVDGTPYHCIDAVEIQGQIGWGALPIHVDALEIQGQIGWGTLPIHVDAFGGDRDKKIDEECSTSL